MKKRIISIITALALCWSLCPTWAFAYEGEWEPDTGTDTGLCAHHTEHTDACGYIAPSEGQPCNHEHMEDCYTIAEDGSEVLDCQHTHDSECGYIQATPGASCGYECPLCPIDALIAALPRALTEDNAETVRWQLDEILDLWRELSEDEQEQIDLSPCWDLQAALDEANVPAPIDEPTEGAVAQVEIAGSITGYNTIEEAWAAANGNTATITLLADVTASSILTVEAGNTITFEGEDYTLTSGQKTAIQVNGTFKLVSGTIKSTSPNAKGIDVSGTLEMTGGAVSASNSYTSSSMAVYADSNSNITISSGKISGVYGISMAGGTVTIQNGEISSWHSAVRVTDGTATIEGGTFTGSFYGMYITGGTVVLHGGTFTGGAMGYAIQSNNDVSTLLDPTKPYVYFDANGQPVALEDGQTTLPEGTYTVGECTHLGALKDLGNGTHGGDCPYCGTKFEAATHTLGADNKCEGCNTLLKVQVQIGETTTYYGGINAAWVAAKGHTATVTLLANVTASSPLTVTGGDDTTFDGGEFTLTGPSDNSVINIMSGGKLTITGGVIKTGVNNLQNSTSAVAVTDGELVVTGGTLEAGTNAIGLRVGTTATVKLSGGTFHDIGMRTITDTVGRLLLNYSSTVAAEKHYAYYQGDEPVDLSKLEKQYVLTDTVTVGECGHKGVTPTPNNDGTHTLTCPYCGYNEAAATNCSYGTEYQYDDTNHWRTCTVCEYENKEAHDWTFIDDSIGNGSVTENYQECIYCEHTKDHLTLTITVPTGLTYGNTGGKQVTYTLSPEKPCNKVTWKFTSGDLLEFADGVLPAGLAVGEHLFHVEGRMEDDTLVFSGNYSLTVSAAPLTRDMVTLSTESVTYSGMEQKPTITVKQGDTTLTAGTDYDVTYSTEDFTNAGTITVTITGKGNYEGTVEKTYTIAQATLTVTGATATSRAYDGTASVAVTAVALDGAVSGDEVSVNTGSLTGTISSANAGDYTTVTLPALTLTGGKAGNYTLTQPNGAVSTNVTISPLAITVTPDSGQEKEYGAADPELKYTITEGQLFGSDQLTGALTYEGSAVGKYEIKQGSLAAPSGNYTLTVASGVMFEITKPSLETAAVGLSPTSYTYDGDPKTPTVTVTKGGSTVDAGEYDITYTNTNGGDGNHTNAGTVTVTVTAKEGGNYSGSCSATFTINPAALTEAMVTLSTSSVTYSGAAQEPAVTVDGLTAETDYTVSYTNNENVGTASVTVTGKGNYTGTVTKTFSITKAMPIVTAPTAGAIEYGQKLSDSTLSGGGAVNGSTTVTGTWNWASPDTQPAGIGDFPATFTPTDSKNYETPANVNVSVTVDPATPEITITATPPQQRAGETVKVTYTVKNPYDANWKDDLPTVALKYTIDGVTKDIDGDSFTIPDEATVGTVITITATSAAVSGKYDSSPNNTATVEVTDKTPVEISGVRVEKREYDGTAAEYSGNPVVKTLDGETVTDVTGFDYTWSTGTAPVNAGTYTLTVSVKTDNQQYIGSTIIEFEITPATITITAPSDEMYVGETVPPLSASDCKIKGLASSDSLKTPPTVAYAETPDTSKPGTVTVKASGAAAPDSGNYNSEIVYVDGVLEIKTKPAPPTPPTPTVIPVTRVWLNRNSLTMKEGEGFRLTAIVEPSNAMQKTVEWSSSNPTVASVDSNGNVTALKPGTTVITVRTRSGGHTDTCTVTVEAPKPETYTITYDANGGSGTMADGTATENAAFTLPECSFTAPAG